jgi:phenylpropionate dioxygenase-like ring-hydroxylating dioxygenase large terminal subunit
VGDLDRAFELFWHPVATVGEVAAALPHPLAVTLLGRDLVVTGGGGAGDKDPRHANGTHRRYSCFANRCAHRSTRLSVGWVEGDGVRCAYHGWRYGADGHCVEIPSMPDTPIPARACVDAFEATVAYGLVWVRLDSSANTAIPACPAFENPAMHVVAGEPYTWPTSAPRRIENFVDLAHFAWVHDGTLGLRDEPVPAMPEVWRENGELRFRYDQPDMPTADEALYGISRYRMPMPLTVDIDFTLRTGSRRHLWMTASPLDSGRCRSFWVVARNDDLDGDLDEIDRAHLAFQQLVLAEDEPVIWNQVPPEISLDPSFELSVRTDKVSIEYRRWLRDLAEAADAPAPQGPHAVRAALFPSQPLSGQSQSEPASGGSILA